MSDRSWRSATYAPGRIDGPVVLVRGRDFYPTRWTDEELPWRVHARCNDIEDAQKIARLLNENVS